MLLLGTLAPNPALQAAPDPPRTSRVQLQARAQFANNRRVPAPPFLDRSWIYTHDATREEPARVGA
jgi:hypothetical protein